jgi:hypothetical protein
LRDFRGGTFVPLVVQALGRDRARIKRVGVLVAKLRVGWVTAFLVFACSIAVAQADRTDPVSWIHYKQEIRLSDMPSLTAASEDPSAVLATALKTIVQCKNLCCPKDSAIEDVVLTGPRTLKDLSTALQGGNFWSDHPQAIHTQYAAQGAVDPGFILTALLDHNPTVIEWKSNFYIVYGAIFDETLHYSGRREYAVHRFLLLDPRFSGDQRQVEFNRDTDDWKTVQGLMRVTVERY